MSDLLDKNYVASQPTTPQRGIFLVFFAVALVAMIGAIGLSVDVGASYRAQTVLQYSLDVSAMRGAWHLLGGLPQTDVEQRAQRLAVANLKLNSFSSPALQAAIDSTVVQITGGGTGLTISAESMQPLSFIPILKGVPDFLRIRARAGSVTRPISLIMVIDRSHSMGHCIATPPANWPCPTGVNDQRLTAAKNAALAVVQGLQVGDQIGLVSFGDNAIVNFDLTGPLSPADLTGLKNGTSSPSIIAAINNIGVGGATYTWDAVAVARAEMQQRFNSSQNRTPIILFLTDGAPHDHIFDDRLSTSLNSSGFANVTSCELNPLGIIGPMPGFNLVDRMKFTCMSCPGYSVDPARPSQLWGYSQSLIEAVRAQRLGYTIHTVGIGVPDTYYDWGVGPAGSGWPNRPNALGYSVPFTQGRNPAQNLGDAQGVKELFLIALANDQSQMINPPPQSLPVPNMSAAERRYFWDFPCVYATSNPSNSTPPLTGADRSADPQGRYAFAQSQAQLIGLWESMIRSARMKLE